MTDVPAKLPATHDADAPPPVLLDYQQAWIADDSQLKVSEKSRRTGLTWAEAADDVLIAAAAKSAGGMNVYYIGYNQDMAIEYVEACGMWARVFNHAASAVEEGLWEDDGDDKNIKTFTIKFPDSGHRIVALSSRPANLRGKQGVVVIDEAAFHDKLGELLKAALALLIWGGRVRVISTHNGEQNPFNELVNDIRAGKRRGSVQRISFKEAVAQGLYRRVCLRLGKEWTAEGEAKWMAEVYAFYGEAASEELDVVPSQGTGAWLSRALIEARMVDGPPVLRLAMKDEFKHWAPHLREAEIRDWCERELGPLLAELPSDCLVSVGEDFGRVSDLTVIVPLVTTTNLVRRVPFMVELGNMPFEQQRQVLFYLCDRLARFHVGALDARGNGAYLAEVATQQYGSRIHEVQFTEGWYREHMPPLKAALEDGELLLPKDAHLLDDLRAIKLINGVARLPKSTGQQNRHGDAAIALALAYFASRQDGVEIDYRSTGIQRTGYEGGRVNDAVGWGAIDGGPDTGGF
ncbi:hypothetical protein [Billgrantia ethanolica]|uniref:Mu-like prophage FluMu protein gp28 n=1 Tax=Billgrantia ethanolica TaxID=2733486 RepID=A0ABS9A5X6_9GAMM|nr:hypothetical protein [Halomonas ethanolica]MCE8004234.1 hypothetical protein [Halomonas ethanolica]